MGSVRPKHDRWGAWGPAALQSCLGLTMVWHPELGSLTHTRWSAGSGPGLSIISPLLHHDHSCRHA